MDQIEIKKSSDFSVEISLKLGIVTLLMAQHRTKQDKMKASIHRVENSKLYSLSDINVSKNTTPIHSKLVSEKTKAFTGLNVKAVRVDLMRTGISLAIVLVLLGVGFVYLG